jgi:hypothetical protein
MSLPPETFRADSRMVMILKRKMRMKKKMERRVGMLKKMKRTRRMRKRRNVMHRVSLYVLRLD